MGIPDQVAQGPRHLWRASRTLRVAVGQLSAGAACPIRHSGPVIASREAADLLAMTGNDWRSGQRHGNEPRRILAEDTHQHCLPAILLGLGDGLFDVLG